MIGRRKSLTTFVFLVVAAALAGQEVDVAGKEDWK